MPTKKEKSSRTQPTTSSTPPPLRAATAKQLSLPSHPRDVPEYTAFWARHRKYLLVLFASELVMATQHFLFRRLIDARYVSLRASKYRGPLDAVAVMASPLFMDVCISATKTLVALFIARAPESLRARVPALFYIVVCRLINAADGVYMCLLQLYHIRLVDDYNDYPWFTGKNVPKQPARGPVLPFLAVVGPKIATGLVLAHAVLFCVGKCYAGLSKSVPSGRKMDLLVTAECAVKMLLYFNSLLSGTPFISSGWSLTIPTAMIALSILYYAKIQKCQVKEWQVLYLFTAVDYGLSRLPTANTMTWFATGLRKAADSLPKPYY